MFIDAFDRRESDKKPKMPGDVDVSSGIVRKAVSLHIGLPSACQESSVGSQTQSLETSVPHQEDRVQFVFSDLMTFSKRSECRSAVLGDLTTLAPLVWRHNVETEARNKYGEAK
jgi:hypothetical protein